jgi:hypothetical protein
MVYLEQCGEAGVLRHLFLEHIVRQVITPQSQESQQFHSFIFFYLFLSGFVFFCRQWTQNGHTPDKVLKGKIGNKKSLSIEV